MKPFLVVALGLLAAEARAELTGFQTPSGNIHCIGGTDGGDAFVDCELIARNDARPLLPIPADCDLDWGSRFSVDEAGFGGMVCHGDTVRDAANPVLPYGRAVGIGSIACTSGEAGLECRNAEGHGFFLSRARQSVF